MPIKIKALPKNWMKFNFSWKNKYPKIVAAMGCINNVKEEDEAGRNANEWVIKDCPRNWQINPKRNSAIIEEIAWGISCSSKINEAINKIKAVNIPDINITDVELYFFLNWLIDTM